MKFIKTYKKYKVMSDNTNWYLCYRGHKVRLYPDSDNIGLNLTEGEKTLRFALNQKQGPHKKSY